MKDINEIELKPGSIVDLHQTVNGQNLFIVLNIENLDVRYAYDLTRKYEYDLNDLFAPCKLTHEVDWEIVSNIYILIKHVTTNP